MPQIFQEKYWELLYHKPQEMDGVGNAKDHVDYLQALFNLEGIKIKSLVDVGFGPGVLLKKIHQRFKPKFSLGLEPSPVMFNKFHHPKIKKTRIDLLRWLEKDQNKERIFDLVICTSVLQYLSEKELKKILPKLAKRCRYLYLTVPTKMEYERQLKEHNYIKDPYAYSRSAEFYQELIKKYFTFISLRLLESKTCYSQKNSKFQDLLFRF